MKVRLLLAAAVVATVGVTPATASAQDPTCETMLLGVPFEATILPDGFVWTDLTVGMSGWSGSGWSGSIDVVDPSVEYPPSITFSAWCSADPALMVRRLTEVSDALSLDETVPVATIGDGTVAVKDEQGVLTLWWTDGSFVGSIRPWGVDAEEITLGDMEAIASALDVVMAGAPEA
jgi:hypothetical protein